MVMSDPIADMLIRIRNANSAYHEKVGNARFHDEGRSAEHPERRRLRKEL